MTLTGRQTPQADHLQLLVSHMPEYDFDAASPGLVHCLELVSLALFLSSGITTILLLLHMTTTLFVLLRMT